MEVIRFIFSGFWIYLGSFIIFTTIFKIVFDFYSRTLRHRSLMKHGYPPSHCNGDGDLIEENED